MQYEGVTPVVPGAEARRNAMTRSIALALPTLLLSACVTTSTTTRTWGEPYGQGWARYGRVESVRETVHRQQGDPAGGAVAGAIIGGLLGNAWSGGYGGATVAGAIGGAMVGSAASQGAAEQRIYEVFVRFDDGALETFVYQGVLPFQPGDPVALTANGLQRSQ
jgi:outer membrane lipoprotein SlyB